MVIITSTKYAQNDSTNTEGNESKAVINLGCQYRQFQIVRLNRETHQGI